MERLLGELHHLVALSPGVQAAIHEWRGNYVGPMCQCSAKIVDALVAINHAHAAAHHLLLRIGRTEIVELLTPLINLVAQVYFDGTDCLTTQTERAGADIARMLLGITQHAEINADGAGDEVTVRITTRATIYRAGVHT